MLCLAEPVGAERLFGVEANPIHEPLYNLPDVGGQWFGCLSWFVPISSA
jgi:hypothetical protein